jgi:RNA polymerase sigma-70 factor, ECF subfamily
VNAILEAPTLMVEIEEEKHVNPHSQDPKQDLSFSPTTFDEPETLLGEHPLGDSTAISTLRGCPGEFPRLQNSGDTGTLRDANAAALPQSWLSKSEIRQSPREVWRQNFGVLYHTYQRRVYRQCYRMLGNQEDAEDLTQEVFIQLFRKADTFRGESSFATWLHRLTVNTVLMQMRRYRRWRAGVTSLDSSAGGEDWTNDVSAVVSALPVPATSPTDKISLDVAIAQLSAGYKEIFLLHDLEGYRHHEIAKLLGISEGTSKSQLHKARLRLRDLLGSADGGNADLQSPASFGVCH